MATKLNNDIIQKYRGIRGTSGTSGIPGPEGIKYPKGWQLVKEQEKHKNMKEIIDALSDAILATGKSFKDIPKSSITDYLTKVGVNKSKHEEIYQKLVEIFAPNQKNSNVPKGDSERNSKYQVVDYTDTTHNDVKERKPRKNVFSEITKIH